MQYIWTIAALAFLWQFGYFWLLFLAPVVYFALWCYGVNLGVKDMKAILKEEEAKLAAKEAEASQPKPEPIKAEYIQPTFGKFKS